MVKVVIEAEPKDVAEFISLALFRDGQALTEEDVVKILLKQFQKEFVEIDYPFSHTPQE